MPNYGSMDREVMANIHNGIHWSSMKVQNHTICHGMDGISGFWKFSQQGYIEWSLICGN